MGDRCGRGRIGGRRLVAPGIEREGGGSEPVVSKTMGIFPK